MTHQSWHSEEKYAKKLTRLIVLKFWSKSCHLKCLVTLWVQNKIWGRVCTTRRRKEKASERSLVSVWTVAMNSSFVLKTCADKRWKLSSQHEESLFYFHGDVLSGSLVEMCHLMKFWSFATTSSSVTLHRFRGDHEDLTPKSKAAFVLKVFS